MSGKLNPPWKPGQSGNPNGRPALPAELRAERKRNMAALIRLVAQYFSLTDEEAERRIAGPEATQLEGVIQGLIKRGKEGDANAAKYLLELMVGKVPEHDPDDNPLDGMDAKEKLAKMKEACALLESQIEKDGRDSSG